MNLDFLKADIWEVLKTRKPKQELSENDIETIIKRIEFSFGTYSIYSTHLKNKITQEQKKEYIEYERMLQLEFDNFVQQLPLCRLVLSVFGADFLFVVEIDERNERQTYSIELINRIVSGKTVIDIIESIPQQPQVQYSTTQQLNELRVAANKLGLYDAADFLK